MGASVTIPMTGGKKTIIIGNRGFNFMAYRPRHAEGWPTYSGTTDRKWCTQSHREKETDLRSLRSITETDLKLLFFVQGNTM